MPLPSAPYAWLWLSCAAISLAACKSQCPPLSIQEGQYCRWTRDDAGIAGSPSGGGKAGTAGRGGSPAQVAWSCTPTEDSCNCVASTGSSEDACTDPRPGCCYAYAEDDVQHCDCVPLEAAGCTELAARPEARMQSSCPP